jgi:uncharacterized protein YukE
LDSQQKLHKDIETVMETITKLNKSIANGQDMGEKLDDNIKSLIAFTRMIIEEEWNKTKRILKFW